ncbi:MAG: CRP-like cAMP-binding protein, partial [Myxococcota bacterium]
PALTVRMHNVGDVVMTQDTEGDELYVLLVGEAKVITDWRTDAETVIATLSPVDLVGEMALLTGRRRSATVIATDTCRFLSLTRAGLNQVLLDHPSVCMSLLRAAYMRIYRMDEKIRTLARGIA